MGCHAASAKVWSCFRCTPNVLIEQVGDAVSGEGSTAGILEYGFVRRIGANDLAQGRSRFRPQRTNALLAALAMEPDLSGAVQSKLSRVDGQGFTDPSPGVVEQKQQGQIARGVRCLRVHGSDDCTGLFGFQIVDDANDRPFRCNSQDSTILIRACDVVPEQVLDEAPEGRQAAVPACRGITPLGFDMVQEAEYRFGPDIIQAQLCHRPALATGQE
jgi:hypothetical protein